MFKNKRINTILVIIGTPLSVVRYFTITILAQVSGAMYDKLA
jgi:hypothetical protein